MRTTSIYRRNLSVAMAMGSIQRQTLALLNDPQHRGRWWTTRHIANALHPPGASKNQVDSVRQALKRLERSGHVEGSGFWPEWRSKMHPEHSPPPSVQRVLRGSLLQIRLTRR